jgi:hypothetical protein
MESSPAYVRQPEGNGCIERFFRTLKEQLLWIQTFPSLAELRQALIDFRHRYDQHWIVERARVSPARPAHTSQLHSSKQRDSMASNIPNHLAIASWPIHLGLLVQNFETVHSDERLGSWSPARTTEAGKLQAHLRHVLD